MAWSRWASGGERGCVCWFIVTVAGHGYVCYLNKFRSLIRSQNQAIWRGSPSAATLLFLQYYVQLWKVFLQTCTREKVPNYTRTGHGFQGLVRTYALPDKLPFWEWWSMMEVASKQCVVLGAHYVCASPLPASFPPSILTDYIAPQSPDYLLFMKI